MSYKYRTKKKFWENKSFGIKATRAQYLSQDTRNISPHLDRKLQKKALNSG